MATAELSVQKYLRAGGTIEELLAKYAIKARCHSKYTRLVLLKYDQIASAMGEEIVRDCRGLIMDRDDNWRAVALAFRKFFNHGEGHAATIDWSTAKVQEKLDGSLCVLYWYRDQWHVATSGTPDASGHITNGIDPTIVFHDLFWRTFLDAEWSLPPAAWRNRCFAFELTAPQNRVVVRHEKPSLTLLAVRDMDTLQELPPEDAGRVMGCPVVRSFPLQSFDQIAETFATMNPLAQEGYVVVDAAYNRVKVKHPGYVALHHMRDGMSGRRMVEVVRSGETDEVLTAFPEFAADMRIAKDRLALLVEELEADYAKCSHIPVGGPAEQKAFALLAVKSRASGYLFQKRLGRVESAKHYVREMRIENLMQLLGLKDSPPPEDK